MECVVKACSIIHNMVAKHRGYEGTMKFRFDLDCNEEKTRPIDIQRIKRPESTYEQSIIWKEQLDNMESTDRHARFTSALSQHT